MTLFIVKIAPKQRSIHEEFRYCRKNLSYKGENVSVIQSIIRHQPAHTDNSQHTPIEFLKPS